jgi:hypothetical protein
MWFLHRLRTSLILLLACIPALAQSDPGSYDDATRLYRNRVYAFSCKVPAGWVLRTEQMNPGADPAKADPASQVLLAAFERPPEATGATPASTILIATESQSSYTGLKTAEDYFGPLTEVVIAKGFKSASDPYPFHLGTITLIRADFTREQKDGSVKDHSEKDPSAKDGSTNDPATVYQSTLVELTHGVILSFTFLAASEDEIDQLIENLSFPGTFPSTPKSPPKSAPKAKTN